MVFIGKDLNHEVIQMLLDRCLLSDEEMEMGPRMWQEAMWDLSPIKLPSKLYLVDNVIKVQDLDYEDKSNMSAIEVFEDKDEAVETKVEFNAVSISSISPQVATTFVYDP